MKSKLMNLVWLNMIGLLLAACKSDAHDVATLKTQDAPRVEAAEESQVAEHYSLRQTGVTQQTIRYVARLQGQQLVWRFFRPEGVPY